MSVFAVCPRLTDEPDLGFLQLANDLARPWFYPDYRLWNNAAWAGLREAEVNNTDKEFRIRLYVTDFNAEDITITTDNRRITVKAKHEEKQEKNCFVSREIIRVFPIPEDVDPKSVTSTMSPPGVVTIKACKKAIEQKETPIPVQYES